jgi:protein-S-isoprenylcysteine O-methyltransferase Ste14
MENDIQIHKRVVGAAISVILVGLVAPAAFWLVTAELDRAFNLSRLFGAPWSAIAGAAGIGFGIFWVLWAWSYLLFVGRGLPLELFGRAIQPTQTLVTTGPYAFTRNPMMLGLLSMLIGIACLRGSLTAFIIVPAIGVVWLFVAKSEEAGLLIRFGDEYKKYRSRVPMLAPKLSAYVHIP